MSELEYMKNEIKLKKTNLQKVVDSRTMLATQVKLRRSRIESLKQSSVDVEEEARKCDQSVKVQKWLNISVV